MNAIAFSLWGNDSRYCDGIIENAKLIQSIYPGWKMFVYADRSVLDEVTLALSKLNVTLRKPKFHNGMFWRFAIAEEPKVKRFLIRDADSRLNAREATAVDEWIQSGKKAHIIADHPYHTPIIGGGLWGATKDAIPNMIDLINSFPGSKMLGTVRKIYNSDQVFLRQKVWPIIRNDTLIHDLCFWDRRANANPFPSKFGDDRFVGEVFLDGKPRHFDWEIRLNYQEA